MASKKVSNSKSKQTRQPPAKTPEARENQLIAAAVDLAEKQIQEGTVSAQVLTHYLKLGSSREKIEQERLAMEVSLMEAKKQNMVSAAKIEELYGEAINAMRAYSGHAPLDTPEKEPFDD